MRNVNFTARILLSKQVGFQRETPRISISVTLKLFTLISNHRAEMPHHTKCASVCNPKSVDLLVLNHVTFYNRFSGSSSAQRHACFCGFSSLVHPGYCT